VEPAGLLDHRTSSPRRTATDQNADPPGPNLRPAGWRHQVLAVEGCRTHPTRFRPDPFGPDVGVQASGPRSVMRSTSLNPRCRSLSSRRYQGCGVSESAPAANTPAGCRLLVAVGIALACSSTACSLGRPQAHRASDQPPAFYSWVWM